MSRIRAQSKLENRITKALWAKGYRFRKNVRRLKGTPDIAIQKYKVVIFIDSCFWHVCPEHGNWPKSNQAFWNQKLARNMERDREVDTHYHDGGWHIMRLWEHEFKNDFEGAVDRIAECIEAAKRRKNAEKIGDETQFHC